MLPLFPFEFRSEVKRQETRVMGLLCGEGCMIVTLTVFDWSTRVTDGLAQTIPKHLSEADERMVGRTDGRMGDSI